MKISLEINMDNAAFEDEGEVKRIISDMVQKMDDIVRAGDGGKLRDINGNVVGKWEVTE
jgi:hypothetical protein